MVVIRSGITRSGWCAVTRGAGAAVAGVSGGDVCLVFAEPDGSRCREPLERCWNVRFEDVPPVRSFPSRQGQRHSPGLWWAATACDHVGYESWLERPVDRTNRGQGLSSDPARCCGG